MNTRRCELCGTLHGTKNGSVSIAIPRSDVDYYSHDHYNLCEVCSLKVYDMLENLKISDGEKTKEQSAMVDLVQRQNAEIDRMRLYVRRAYDTLLRSEKNRVNDDNTRKIIAQVDTAIELLDKVILDVD